jgi:hypothetical protein
MRKPREIHVSICNRVAHVTAGSHQPLLVHDAGSLKDNDIRGAQTHIRKSGGRQPAVVLSNAALSVMCWKREARLRNHGRLTPPAPGAVATTVRRKEWRFLRCTNAYSQERRASARRGCDYRACNGKRFRHQRVRTSTRAAGVSPPWAANRISNSNAMNFRVSSSHAEGNPRGAYAPRSWCCCNDRSPERMAISAVHKRIFARAAGVSPPWV